MWASRWRSLALLVLSGLLLIVPECSPAATVRVCIWQGGDPAKAKVPSGQRGAVYLQRNGKNWLLINELDVEEYLYGVVGSEMNENCPLEALKAQAVCSRTLAIQKISQAAGAPYHLDTSTSCQVYSPCEDDRVIRAVDETRGLVLAYAGKLGTVFFHASCGGLTTPSSAVWGGDPDGTMMVRCPCGDASPYRQWTRTISCKHLASVLGRPVKTVSVDSCDETGRVLTVTIALRSGQTVSMSGHQLRTALNAAAGRVAFANPLVLPSTLFTCTMDGDRVVFTGKGYGHGVGLCQEGARIMAERGFTFEEILRTYFPCFTPACVQQREEYGEKDPLACSD